MEDQALAAAAARGNQQAFTAIVERYRRYIYAIAYRIVLGEEDALDVTQNVYLQLARKIGDYDGRGSLKGWLAAITVRQALDHLRRPGRVERPTEPAELEALAGPCPAGEWGEARESLEREEQRRAVTAAMAGLSPQQRAIFALRFMEDLGPKEIGERLGLPPSQVRSQLTKAVARIREIVTRERC